jgi:hypothetical protein
VGVVCPASTGRRRRYYLRPLWHRHPTVTLDFEGQISGLIGEEGQMDYPLWFGDEVEDQEAVG